MINRKMDQKTKAQTLKGFRDFLPAEALKRQWLKNELTRIFESWGYDPMETPTIEALNIFENQIGEDEMLFYKFKDLGGRDVALRYDQTVPTCRVVGQYTERLSMPFRRYQIQPAFRAEKPQKGRYREFIQCDADIFGTKSPYADAELISLSLEIFKQLGFKEIKVLINNRALLKKIPYQAISVIDKLEKIGEDQVLKKLSARGFPAKQSKMFLDFIKNLSPDKTTKIILGYLKNRGFKRDWYQFQPTLVRSFSYSTGPIWEVKIPGFNSGSLIGGERYDQLVKNITGKDIPGTGFGLGFDRTLEAAEQFGLVPEIKTKTKVLVTVFSSELSKESLKAAATLQKKGVNAELYPDPAVKLDKQLKYADRKGVPYAIIIGPDEIENNTVVLKDLIKKEQKELSLEEIEKILKV